MPQGPRIAGRTDSLQRMEIRLLRSWNHRISPAAASQLPPRTQPRGRLDPPRPDHHQLNYPPEVVGSCSLPFQIDCRPLFLSLVARLDGKTGDWVCLSLPEKMDLSVTFAPVTQDDPNSPKNPFPCVPQIPIQPLAVLSSSQFGASVPVPNSCGSDLNEFSEKPQKHQNVPPIQTQARGAVPANSHLRSQSRETRPLRLGLRRMN